MRKILSFTKKKKKLSTNASDTSSETLAGYELKEKDLGKLHKAASTGDLSKLRQLIKKNNVNQLDKQNRAPLHLACARGHADVVALLVENKSKLNICDNENRSPLMKAVQCEQERCAVILLGHDADPNLVDINGYTALHLAVLIPNISLVMHLLEHGAHINAQDKDGCTPLLLAVTAKHQEVAEFILKKGADVNAKNKTGRTALMIAASNGQINLVKLLLRYGIDASLKENNGWTAEDHALMNGHHACSHLIIEHNTKKRHQSPHLGPRMMKGMPSSPDHAAKVSFGFGGPAIDKEKYQESPDLDSRTRGSEKVIDDLSQIESFSGESKSAGDSWLSSNEEDDIECTSKVPQKFNLTKLINSSQQNKESINEEAIFRKAQLMGNLQPVESDTDRVEELENDCQNEEEVNENNGSPTHLSLQSRNCSPKTVGRSFSFPVENHLNSTPLKGNREGMSLEEEEAQPLKACSRTEAIEPVNFSEPSAYAIQVQEVSPKKTRRDLLLELGLEEAEDEENTESLKDSESVSDGSWNKSIDLFVSSGVLSQRDMKNQDEESMKVNTTSQPPLSKFTEDKRTSEVLTKARDSEDDSDWDSESASIKNESAAEFNSTPCENQIRKIGKLALQSPNEELSNTNFLINKPKSESETACVFKSLQSEGSADSMKTRLSSYSSTQNQVAPELQLGNYINAGRNQENVCKWQMSPTENGDNEKGKNYEQENEITVAKVKQMLQQNNEVELKLGKGDSSTQLQPSLMTSVHKETPAETFLNKDRTGSSHFKGNNLGSNEENYENHQHNQTKQADQELKSIELKNIERLLRLQQVSAMNALSAFDDSTASEMSQDEERACKASSSKTFTKPVNISDDLNDLTESSDTAAGGSESSEPVHRNTAQLIAQLDAETVDSVSLLKIQNVVQEYERAVEREKKRYTLLLEKVKYLEKERKELHQTLKETREMKSKLECQIMEKETDLNSLKFSMKQEEEKRKTAEMLYEKSREQLQKKEFQYCEEKQAKHESELMIRNLEIERDTLITNLQKLNEEQKELQSQFNQERARHKEILNGYLHKQQEIEIEDNMALQNIEPLAQCDNHHEKAVMEQNRALQDEVTVLKRELHCLRERNQEEQEKYMEQVETLKVKLEDAKKDLRLNEDTLTQTALQYNGQLNAIKTEVSMLTSKLELEKQNKDYQETEKEAILSRLNVTLQELERSQIAKCEFERILQRERDEWVHSNEKRSNEISNLRETNNNMSQRLSKEEEKSNDLDKKLHRAKLSLAEKNLALESVQRDLKQSQDHITDLEQTNKLQKEQISKYEVRQVSLQERLAQAHSEITLLHQQLEDAQNKGIMKEKVVADVQDRFNNMFATLRGDSEHRLSLMEKRNEELLSKNIEQREQICKFENEKNVREATLRQLQQDLADSLKKLSMSEASLEVITRSRNEMEDEKTHIQKQLLKLKVKLQETQDKNMHSERKIQQLENVLEDKERDLFATSQKIQEAFSTSSQRNEATKQLEEQIQRLEIENAKLEAVAKQQTNKSELMEKELKETESVRARLEDLITSLQGVKVNLEDQLGQELQKQVILSQNAKDSHQLWEEELKSRSKLGLRLIQLDKEKNDLSDQVDIEKKKVKKLVRIKQSVETRLAYEIERNNELQKELNRMRTLVKTAKKKLKQNETEQVVSQINGIQELDHEHSETGVTISRLKSKTDELSKQLEVESAKRKCLESTNQELSEQIRAMQFLQKNHDQLEKRKQQLEDELLHLKNQVETQKKDCNHLENYKRKTEEQARKEIKQKLEEVNAFFKAHHASRETLDELKASNELSSRKELEQKNRDLELELSKLRSSQEDSLNLKESAQKEIERYKELYSEELKLRKSIAAKLDRSNERLAEANTKLLKERFHSKSLIADSIENKGLTTTPALNESHLQNILGNGSDLGTSNRDLGSNLNPAEDGLPPNKRVVLYLFKMQDELQKSITKELAQANADLDSVCSRISPLGSATCSLASTNQVQDPVTTATEQYLEVLKKNYMI
ncbi:ankyrin repeat domain-containing protein 26 isoform X2 [Pristis pectinata]|uniref:ankyrin repeat domain-containing protein 26 isoform X2 n=1 Tax=Pristis pectinata TaxID=685728 RepID=UPI00223D1018|nr:ankyrin repeat domain-containing protein 26 isoform X2 [Pristis pectinata]